MIVLDTCTAIKCFEFSKSWNINLHKKCPTRNILWDEKPNSELLGLAKDKVKYSDYSDRINKGPNTIKFNMETDLTEDEFISYIIFVDEISINDTALLLADLGKKNQSFNLAELKENGKKRLSNVDKDLIALALIKTNSILASDDNRILTLIEKYYTSQLFCCSAKILEKTNEITCKKELKKKLTDKHIYYFESRHKRNTLSLC
jgi:hypothetical protein